MLTHDGFIVCIRIFILAESIRLCAVSAGGLARWRIGNDIYQPVCVINGYYQ
jgi:hypothetical protein